MEDASVGNCEHCHPDPRGDSIGWAADLPGDNGYKSGIGVPTQLACKECHVSFSNGKMIITKFSRSNYVDYKQDYYKSAVHIIENADLAAFGRINNYGICFSCHNGITAIAVKVWHARPDKHHSSWVYGQSKDERCTGRGENWTFEYNPNRPLSLAKYLPGRTSGTIGRFNLFNVPGFGYIPGKWDYGPCDDADQYQSTPLSFKRIAIPAVAGNGNTSGTTPVFPSLYRMTPDGEIIPAPPTGNNALPGDYSFIFNYTGSTQTLFMPPNATNIQFTVKGGGGGGGRRDNGGLQTNGKPGSKVIVTSTTTNVTLTIYVASGGKMGSETYIGAPGGWGNPPGGKGGDGDEDGEDGWAFGGAGGGGASAIYTATTKLAEAAGGAGGRSDDWYDYWDYEGGSGGSGGGVNHYPSGTVSLTGGGIGGTTAPSNGGNGQVVITYKVPWN